MDIAVTTLSEFQIQTMQRLMECVVNRLTAVDPRLAPIKFRTDDNLENVVDQIEAMRKEIIGKKDFSPEVCLLVAHSLSGASVIRPEFMVEILMKTATNFDATASIARQIEAFEPFMPVLHNLSQGDWEQGTKEYDRAYSTIRQPSSGLRESIIKAALALFPAEFSLPPEPPEPLIPTGGAAVRKLLFSIDSIGHASQPNA